MPDAKTANKIAKRIGNKDLPENPVDFQKLIHNYKGKLIGPELAEVNKYMSPGYHTLNLLLKDYCSSCNLENSCDWNKQVKMAAGENYPFWLKTWPRIRFPLYENEPYFTNGNTIMCTHYQSDELTKQKIKNVQQPLTRLMKIIEEKKQNNYKKTL
jgi:hypothetical protein